MKSYTREEFIEYVKTLEFEELEDCARFVASYYDYYKSINPENKEEADAAWEKYMILMSKFGMMFVSFSIAVVEYRKKLNEELIEEENSSGGSLENRVSET